ncbi:MAG: hypothetical protein B7X12_07055 [Halothiobacillus sp. 20-53-49]|nr:MAG: hypothetical protein B7X12_07055 [Halothiobacillus sp. 20-53-49]
MIAPVIFITPLVFLRWQPCNFVALAYSGLKKPLNILGLWHEQRWHYAHLLRVAHNAWRFGAKVIVLKII